MKVTYSFISTVIFCFAVSLCSAITYYVDDDAPNDPGPGNTLISDPLEDGSLFHPFDAIQEAIDAAMAGATILIRDGIYTGSGNTQIYIDKPLSLEGVNGPASCIIDFTGQSPESYAGFRIEGVFSVSERVSFYGLCMRNAYTHSSGGVIFSLNSRVFVKDCIFEDNTASNGGAIRCYLNSEAVIEDCIIRRNHAENGNGGGIYTIQSWVTLRDCQVYDNTCLNDGGGICSYDTYELVLERCEVLNNSAMGSGGGIFMGQGVISDSIIRGNISQETGGGIKAEFVRIHNSHVCENTALGRGGGIYANNPSIYNSLICENTSQYGGGGLFSPGIPNQGYIQISGCTIVNNLVLQGYGGGIRGDGRIINSILQNNRSQEGQQLCTLTLLWLSHCNLSNYDNDILTFNGEGEIIDKDVIYSESNSVNAGYWDDNGSPYDFYDDTLIAGDYHLPSGSPCIDTGEQDLIGLLTEQDLEGQVRILDGDDDGTSQVDMGCYEFVPEGAAVIQTDPSRVYFKFEQGDPNQQSQTIRIYNSGTGAVNWTLSEDCGWLEADLTSGSADANGIEVMLNADVTGLDPNVYTCDITLADTATLNSPYTVTVVLYVLPAYGSGDLWVPFHYGSIQEAVNFAGSEDTIIVADGKYSGTGLSIQVPITLRSATGPEHCVIFGKWGFSEPFGIRFDETGGLPATFEGFTLTEFISKDQPYYAMLCILSNPIIKNCFFINNVCLGRSGAAIHSTGANPSIEDCEFLGNTSKEGGAVWVLNPLNGDVHFMNSCFRENLAYGYDGWTAGGAVYLEDSRAEFDGCMFSHNMSSTGGAISTEADETLTIRSSHFIHNSAGGKGGGISCFPGTGTIQIEDCEFISNASTSSDGGGAYIYSNQQEATVHITDCLFDKNSANSGGGICFLGSDYCSLSVTGSRCVLNYADSYGGGIFGNGGILELDRVIIEGNYSAGIEYSPLRYWSFSDPFPDPLSEGQGLIMNHCLVFGNRSQYLCGGLGLSGIGRVYNSIFWNNESANFDIEQSQIGISGAALDIGYSDILGGTENIQRAGGISNPSSIYSLGVLDTDPLFIQAGYWDDSGTPGDWSDDEWVQGDYHLVSEGWRWDVAAGQWTWDAVTSPCIDAGSPGALLGDEPLTVEVDPLNRWGENVRVNMGAYGGTAEASMASLGWALLADMTNDGIVDFDDFMVLIDSWLSVEANGPADLSRQGGVTMEDMALFAGGWLETTIWY